MRDWSIAGLGLVMAATGGLALHAIMGGSRDAAAPRHYLLALSDGPALRLSTATTLGASAVAGDARRKLACRHVVAVSGISMGFACGGPLEPIRAAAAE